MMDGASLSQMESASPLREHEHEVSRNEKKNDNDSEPNFINLGGGKRECRYRLLYGRTIEEWIFGGGGKWYSEKLTASGKHVKMHGSRSYGVHYAGVDPMIGSCSACRPYGNADVDGVETAWNLRGFLTTR